MIANEKIMSCDLRKGSDGVQKKIKGCLWLTLGLIILEVKAGNELAISLPVHFKSVKKYALTL